MNPPIALLVVVWLIGLIGLAGIAFGVRAVIRGWTEMTEEERMIDEKRSQRGDWK